MKVVLLIHVAMMLSGCATTLVDPSLLTCAPQPASPVNQTDITQQDTGLYVVDLAVAGDDCRTKLGSVARILNPEYGK